MTRGNIAELNDLIGGRMFLMANMDGRTCLYIAEGSSVHAVGRATVDGHTYYRVEVKMEPELWWVPHSWDSQ